ncbi:hypothetical protein [Thalassotalea marina]|uniref:Uncharacterized protein n=1 Tax=Thalassotalea marina TaxID=1673741 RepID=A0A919BCG6_9GAMM|nr:hypothetical protein [Thalassotalea marina]GHF80117.1 hypothetical protein GCM10017161_04210 [Thalassotalea marina]
MNNKILLSVSCLFLLGLTFITFGLQGDGKLSLAAIVEVAKGKRSISEIFTPIQEEQLPQISYPEAYFKYDLDDQNTYYSALVDEGFAELYSLFVATNSDEEIYSFIQNKNKTAQSRYRLAIGYDEKNRRNISIYMKDQPLSQAEVTKLFLTRFNYIELKTMFADSDMLHKVDRQHLQYLTAILSFDRQGNFVDLRRR